ncbi:MAG: ABC transporter substrate-binding protein [Bradyrhizobiaceae bacterium]|nr:ABC transporter substrate-binding protein [Bradyrhizobiaceae bacterium]
MRAGEIANIGMGGFSIRSIGLGVAGLFAAALAAIPPVAAQPQQATVRVQLLWHHQAQFAGLYVADAKGFYAREGIAVQFLEGGPGINPLEFLVSGKADVAVSWLPTATAARERGWPVVNVAQIFQHSGMAVVCRRAAGVRSPDDIPGKRIGVWNVGDELNLRYWLRTIGAPPDRDRVEIIEQRPDGRDLIDGSTDCATAMMYNEYWSILDAGFSPVDLMLVRLSDEGLGFLEDGLYAPAAALDDPAKRDALTRFLRATAAGWTYAAKNVDETHAIAMAAAPHLNAAHQRRMLETVLRLVGDGGRFGLLDLDRFRHSIDIIAGTEGGPNAARNADSRAWTHRVWYEAGLGVSGWHTIAQSTRHRLLSSVSERWFYALALIGTATFALAGFMRARQRRYDLWGAFILTMLPAAGGGILRDLLVGGDRHPPFIFKDPAYIFVILSVLAFGVIVTSFVSRSFVDSKEFDRTLTIFDTIGLATFTVVGAQVALIAELHWIWVPFCAALTCAGGGMLLDIVTGREPRTFLGEPYEEIAIGGGLILYAGLQIADNYEHTDGIVFLSMTAAMVFVVVTRTLVVMHGWRTFRLGHRRERPARPAKRRRST